MRIDLPSGGWAEFRDDIENISVRDRRPVFLARWGQPDGIPDMVVADGAMRALLPLVIVRWDVTGPDGAGLALPRENPKVLDELRAGDYDRLVVAGWDDGVWRKLFPRFDPSPDPDSPFDSSDGSNGGPAAVSSSTLVTLSPPSGSVTGSSPASSAGP